jgi:arylsulfatase A-like enzyme/Flp pilus assembly protein TadD
LILGLISKMPGSKSMKIKKNGLVILFTALIEFGIMFSGGLLQAAEGNNTNVLLITIDTLRPDRLSCYSTEYLKTPNIDALAERGVLFERAFAHTPITLPSHANILLGTTPLYHGVHDNGKFRVQENFFTLAEYLKTKGYSTAAFIGAFSLDSRFGLNQGFDVYDESYPSRSSVIFVPAERKAEDVIKPALSWLEEQNSKWFAWIHLWDPHTLYQPPEPFATKYKDDPYSGEVAYVDSELKKIFDFLENENIMDSTLIIFTGDHGESLGEHGELAHTYFAYNSTLWVPLIITGPGIEKSRNKENVCHVDIFPTLCEILEMDPPSFLQGVSLLPLMEGKQLNKKRAIYFESLGPYLNQGWAPQRGFIDGKDKFIDSPIPELYDLDSDFIEKNNIIENKNVAVYLKKLNEMKEELSSARKTPQDAQQMDRETQDKLRSLGYIVSPTAPVKKSYGPEDDLKTLLPFQQKLDQAIILGDEGRIEESTQLLNEIIAVRKDFVQAYLYLYNIFIAQGQREKVMDILERGMTNNPDNYSITAAYGIFLVREGQFDKGIDVLQRALAILDFDPEVWHYMGFAYSRKAEDQKALEYYNKSIALKDGDPLVYYNLGTLYLAMFMKSKKMAEHALAMETFKKAIDKDQNFVLAYRGLGIGYRIIRRPMDAITVWEQGLQLSPDDEFLISNIADTNLALGNKAQAVKYFERLLSLKSSTMTPEDRNKIESLLRELKKD